MLGFLIENIPAPSVKKSNHLQALIVDSWFDNYLGVVSLVKVVNGSIKVGDLIEVHSKNNEQSSNNRSKRDEHLDRFLD